MMTFEEMKKRVQDGTIGLPIEFDEESDELVINVDPSDAKAMAKLEEFLAEEGISLPVPDEMIDIHEGHEGGVTLDMDEDDPDLPEFDIMTLMVSNMDDESMLDYVTNLVCGGIYDMVDEAGPAALQALGIELRDDWDIDWEDVIETKDFEGTVRYMLGQFPLGKLRSVAELAFKRAILVMLSEGSDFVNMIMGQMAAQIVVSNDPDADEDNPLIGL